jgi:cysteinyl-tRNA synthetase
VLRLYDTRHRRVEDITPATPGVLRVYGCGPTVYSHQHVGNMRTYLLNDLIARVAVLAGWRVDLVVNITDVGHVADDTVVDAGEDKMLVGARREGLTIGQVAQKFEAAFLADLNTLNILPAAENPRASQYIDRMIELVGILLDGGHAYIGVDGTVYFDARSFPSYGEISGNRLDGLRPSPEDEREAKRFHADWALWKSAEPDAPVVFPSPWGPGFPGWHLECSAMSSHLLGDTIDIHTGGIDLRFPHHEDERAQTESAVGHEVVRHWVHGEHLLFEGRKMAKSAGNVVLVSDLVDAGLDPLALRLAYERVRYRQQVTLSWEELVRADKWLTRWRSRMADWSSKPGRPMDAHYAGRARAALFDDLDVPAALIALQDLEKDTSVPDGAKFETFNDLDRVLALDLQRELGAAPPKLPPGAQAMLDERASARTAKRWAESDRLRDALAALGVAVTDTPEGQVARPV